MDNNGILARFNIESIVKNLTFLEVFGIFLNLLIWPCWVLVVARRIFHLLQCAGSLVVACELLVAVCGI